MKVTLEAVEPPNFGIRSAAPRAFSESERSRNLGLVELGHGFSRSPLRLFSAVSDVERSQAGVRNAPELTVFILFREF